MKGEKRKMDVKRYELNKVKAERHTEMLEQKYAKEISYSAENTKVYGPDMSHCTKEQLDSSIKAPEIVVDAIGSVEALKYAKGKTAVLNFASYKEPGGLFMQGAMAQEECICHESDLYNVLSRKTEYYKWNNEHKNKALYTDRALYSPDILFAVDGKLLKYDVISCACPNKKAAKQYCKVSDTENSEVLVKRIQTVFKVAADNHVETIILGAFGCGVFGQNPEEVAEVFKTAIIDGYNTASRIVFAIPDKTSTNYKAFEKRFKGNVKALYNSLSTEDKDSLYRMLWMDHVIEDIKTRITECEDDIPDDILNSIAEKVATEYVYNGQYDCNLSYWDNIDNLIQKYR